MPRASEVNELRRTLVALGIAALACAAVLIVRNATVDDPLERLAKARDGQDTAYRGTWHFPRGGPYVLGFESPNGPASLQIADKTVARGSGLVVKRHVYDAGNWPVTFTAPDGARLLWHPPGRRGPPEYVPPSSLSPKPPDQARFAGAGASVTDGVSALALLVIALALIAYLARSSWRGADRKTVLATVAIFAAGLALRLLDLGGAGQTWDEDVNWSAGRNYVTNWLSGDFAQASWQWNYEHPPVMKYIAGIGAQFADGYGPARALSAILMALGCALVVLIGRRLYSLRVGVLAGAIAALSPHLIAHGKIVGHEAPTVLWWTLAIWLSLRLHDGLADTSQRQATRIWAARLAVIGLVFGLAVWSRFVNALMAPLIAAIVLIEAPRGTRLKILGLGTAIVPPVVVLLGLIIWPRLWDSPIAHLIESWDKLKKPHSAEPFLGAITNQPGRHYFAVYLWATAPIAVIAGAIAWLVRAGTERKRAAWIVGLWLVVPMAVALSPVRQDGVRYIMPSLVALAVAAAAGFDYLALHIERRWAQARRWAFVAMAGLIIAYLAAVNARIHPYYLDYYGEQVGGTAGAASSRGFEVAWWGEGLADAVDYVNRHAAKGDRMYRGCVEPGHLTWFRGDLWNEVRKPEQADWILAYQPSWRRCPVPAGYAMVHEVKAAGAPLVRVYRRPQ